MKEPNPKKLKTRFYQRTDMYWFLAVVSYFIGILFVFSGLNIGFTDVEIEEGVSRIAVTIIVLVLGLFSLLFAVYETYHLYRCQFPLIVLYREGLQIREIGMIRTRSVRPLWGHIVVAQGQGTNVIDLIYTVKQTDETEDGDEVYKTFGVTYTAESFGVSLKKVVQSLDYYQNNLEARKAFLRSWEGWNTVFSGHELPR